MNTQKEIIRKLLQDWRHGLSQEYVAEASQRIFERCIELIDWPNTKVIHIYLPNRKQHEIDTWQLLHYIWKNYPSVITAVPAMENNRMVSHELTAASDTRESSFGIPEPLSTRKINSKDINVVIVPVTGFTKTGYRLGYGLGHYDRFLASLSNAVTIGLAYDKTEIDFPVESHDVPLTYIVTEKRVVTAS